MGLVVASVLLLAGCYDPSLKDCTVSCSADTDCAHGQACASGGWCAAQGMTCTAQMLPIDAAEAKPIDAPAAPTPDAMGNATLRVTVQNHGEVVIDGVGTCNENMDAAVTQGPAMMTTCTYSVVAGTQLTATATVTATPHAFDKWTDPLCKSQGAACTFTVLPFTQIQAQFK